MMQNPSARVPNRADDALEGLETIVDWKDVVLTVRYGRELQRNATKWRFIPWFYTSRCVINPPAGSPVFR